MYQKYNCRAPRFIFKVYDWWRFLPKADAVIQWERQFLWRMLKAWLVSKRIYSFVNLSNLFQFFIWAKLFRVKEFKTHSFFLLEFRNPKQFCPADEPEHARNVSKIINPLEITDWYLRFFTSSHILFSPEKNSTYWFNMFNLRSGFSKSNVK